MLYHLINIEDINKSQKDYEHKYYEFCDVDNATDILLKDFNTNHIIKLIHSKSTKNKNMNCKCKSYNNPKDYQCDSEVIVSMPIGENKFKDICLDHCIAKDIMLFWKHKIGTGGSCSGNYVNYPNMGL
jgi:hypothetical protein